MMIIYVLRPLLCTCLAKWAERSQRWNTLHRCPRRDSNLGGGDLWSNTLPGLNVTLCVWHRIPINHFILVQQYIIWSDCKIYPYTPQRVSSLHIKIIRPSVRVFLAMGADGCKTNTLMWWILCCYNRLVRSGIHPSVFTAIFFRLLHARTHTHTHTHTSVV